MKNKKNNEIKDDKKGIYLYRLYYKKDDKGGSLTGDSSINSIGIENLDFPDLCMIAKALEVELSNINKILGNIINKNEIENEK